MADNDIGPLFGYGLGKGRKVRRRDRKDHLIPRTASGFDCLFVVGDCGTAANGVDSHADYLSAFLDVLTEFAHRLTGDLKYDTGAV